MTINRNLSKIKALLQEDSIIDWEDLLARACAKHHTSMNEVQTKMMSSEDLQDLKNGLIPYDSLELHIQVWCKMGKPNQNEPTSYE